MSAVPNRVIQRRPEPYNTLEYAAMLLVDE